jgi:hypothetical protein
MRSAPWGAVKRSTGEKIPRLLWNWKVEYAVHKSMPLDPIQNQMNEVYIVAAFIIHFNIIFKSECLKNGLVPSSSSA